MASYSVTRENSQKENMFMNRLAQVFFILFGLSISICIAQDNPTHPNWPGPGQLFVGTCYQPIDRTPEEIDHDIAIMKRAGFNVVRIGDLSWDSFELSQGKFNFDWWDEIVAKMHANGIGVIMDIPGSPAPIWLHRRYPGVDIVTQNGTRLPPAERYMDDISDPNYAREVKVLAEAMTKHYAHNPAILAIGYDNEIGNGYMSYSADDRERFIAWLKNKYGTIGELNKAWATQRWSRRLSNFDDVDLPLANGPGPSERYLDLHRFWSDVSVERLEEIETIRRRNMPDIPSISNLWDNAPRRGFDYLATYKSYVSYGAEGFYPSDPVSGSLQALMTKGALSTPIWFNEFTIGGGGWYGEPGRSRMYSRLALMLGAQGILAWTFNSHQGGEEQAIFGLLDHDNSPTWKVEEFSQIASDYKLLSKYGFPRYIHPEVAIAYSFDSYIDSQPNGPSNTTLQYFKPSYTEQVQGAFEALFTANIDTAIINIGHESLTPYKLVVIPADYVMDTASAKAIRDYVSGGGTVLMTAFSAKVDEHGQWFNTPLPGRLSDVFGVRTAQFYEPKDLPEFEFEGKTVQASLRYYEVVEPGTARTLARFSNLPGQPAAITMNEFGRGKAIYLAAPPQPSLIGPILRSLYGPLGIAPGPLTPQGVYARVVEGRTLYVNTTKQEQRISINGTTTGILSNRTYHNNVVLGAMEADLIP
jgi:beta-galactosidase